jgi:hypothetical protein
MPSLLSVAPFPAAVPSDPPRIEVVVPVYNEQGTIAASIRRLHDHLTAELPFAWRIVIANNARGHSSTSSRSG